MTKRTFDIDAGTDLPVRIIDATTGIDLTEALLDGRYAAFHMRRILPDRFSNVTPIKSDDRPGLFLFDIGGAKTIIRILNANGIALLPSNVRGQGRVMNDDDKQRVADEAADFLAIDVRNVAETGNVRLHFVFTGDLREMKHYSAAEFDHLLAELSA